MSKYVKVHSDTAYSEVKTFLEDKQYWYNDDGMGFEVMSDLGPSDKTEITDLGGEIVSAKGH